MVLVTAYKTDIGRKPTHNEDYIWVNEKAGIYIVADGLGGQEAGEVASHLAATTVGEFLLENLDSTLGRSGIKSCMIEALELANETVWRAGRQANHTIGMASTIVVALIRLPLVYICHAGDARAYLVQNESLIPLTEDHSLVAQLRAAGVVGPKDKPHRLGHVVTKAIGQEGPLEPAFTELTVHSQDWLILCSDGFWNMVSESQLLSRVKQAQSSQTTDSMNGLVDVLIDEANNAGGKDNISIIAISFLGA